MEAYLDNSATTRCYESVAELVRKTMLEDYGNPSSMHRKGVEAERYVREAQEKIAKTLKAEPKEIYFTSGGTESDNWALIGTALANQRKGRHLITTAIEHPAVSAPASFLEEQGFEVTRLGVDKEGHISLEDLKKALRKDTILVSVMYVNNEMGAVQPIEEIAGLVHEVCPGAYFHVDAIQAYGKYRICPKRMGIDLLSVSGHKIHGPKGTGFLYVREGVKLFPYIYGGGQQRGFRSGTDNVPGAAGLGEAAACVYKNLEENEKHMRRLKLRLAEGIRKLDQTVIHGGDPGADAPHILNVSFLGVRSEVLLHTLEERGIYISAGSACSSHKRSGSPTLTAIGLSRAELESAVRFSFAETTREEEIDYALSVLAEVLLVLRRFTRR